MECLLLPLYLFISYGESRNKKKSLSAAIKPLPVYKWDKGGVLLEKKSKEINSSSCSANDETRSVCGWRDVF